jgi:hypothetical protein
MWYFSRDSDDKGKHASLARAYKWLFVNHIGSIAIGSLIIAIA